MSDVTPDMLTAIERMAFDAYREGYMAGNEVGVKYEYESRVAHAEGRAVRYVEARLDRFAALSTRVRELETMLIECQAGYECDLMAVGHDKDGPARTQAMAGLRDIIARIAALLPQAPNKPEPK